MSEATNSALSASTNLVAALVKKACDRLADLATSSDEINSLKRLTILMELQKSWESINDIMSIEKQEERLQQRKDLDRETNVVDIVICHDCGRIEPPRTLKSSTSFVCHQCGLSFQKCLPLMRHLLTHNLAFNGIRSSHGNGVNGNDISPSLIALSSQEHNISAKDFYIFMNPASGKETGSDMSVKLENSFENMYDDEDDDDEDGDDEDDYNNNGDDEDDGYSRSSENQKSKDASVPNFSKENSRRLKKEESSKSSHSVSKENIQGHAREDGGTSGKLQLASGHYSFFPKLECPACGRHFRRTNSLKNHMAIHTSRGPFFGHSQRSVSSGHGRYKRLRSPSENEDRPALCCDCGKQFVNLKRLKIHALSHSAPGRYSCSKCPLKFSVAASLKRHLQRHSGVRPHVCSKCGKSFVRSDELTAHERLHSNRNKFPCPVCGKGFTRSIDMIRHQSCHETTKPYQCNQCHKSFVRHDFLKKHESTHLSRVCPFCKDVFENRRNITLHIKKEHPDKSVEDLFNISQSKLVVNPEAFNEAQSIVSILEPNNLYEVPRTSLQIELSPLADDSISPPLTDANQLSAQTVEREEEFS